MQGDHKFPTDSEAKKLIVEIGRRMYTKNFVAANDGNRDGGEMKEAKETKHGEITVRPGVEEISVLRTAPIDRAL